MGGVDVEIERTFFLAVKGGAQIAGAAKRCEKPRGAVGIVARAGDRFHAGEIGVDLLLTRKARHRQLLGRAHFIALLAILNHCRRLRNQRRFAFTFGAQGAVAQRDM